MTGQERAREWLNRTHHQIKDEILWIAEPSFKEIRISDLLAAYAASEYQRGLKEGERRGMERAAVTLKDHWLVSVECLRAAHFDVAHCYCGWKGPVRANVGLAVGTWIEHVEAQAAAIRQAGK